MSELDMSNGVEFERPLDGITQITGPHDTGKTLAAWQCGANPARIVYFEDDVKGHQTIKDLEKQGIKPGMYVDLLQAKRDKKITSLAAYHDMCIAKLEEAVKQKLDVLIWDTVTDFEKSLHAYVTSNLNKFRNPGEWTKGPVGYAEQWSEVKKYYRSLLGWLQDNFKSIYLIHHLKDEYLNTKKTGRQIPSSSAEIDKVCRLRFYLLKNPKSAVPIALCLKRPVVNRFVEGKGIRSINILPYKLTPLPHEQSIWDVVERYYNDPMGNREPTPEETPNAFELSIIQNTLTPDMEHMFRLSITDTEPEPPAKPMTPEEHVKELAAGGYTVEQIAETVGLVIPVVTSILSQ